MSLPITAILLAGCLVTAWFLWACFARVTLYEVTNSARLEVARAAYTVQSSLAARFLASYLAVNREVKAGEVLVELDASLEGPQLPEEQARMAALEPELDALRRQADAEQRARNDERQAEIAATEKARADARRAEAPARYALR